MPQALERGDSGAVEPLLLPASDKTVRAAARSLPQEHAAAMLAVAVLHLQQRPGGNAKLCVAAKELLLAHGASFEHSEGEPLELSHPASSGFCVSTEKHCWG